MNYHVIRVPNINMSSVAIRDFCGRFRTFDLWIFPKYIDVPHNQMTGPTMENILMHQLYEDINFQVWDYQCNYSEVIVPLNRRAPSVMACQNPWQAAGTHPKPSLWEYSRQKSEENKGKRNNDNSHTSPNDATTLISIDVKTWFAIRRSEGIRFGSHDRKMVTSWKGWAQKCTSRDGQLQQERDDKQGAWLRQWESFSLKIRAALETEMVCGNSLTI